MAKGYPELSVEPEIVRELGFAARQPAEVAKAVAIAETLGPQPGLAVLIESVSKQLGRQPGDVRRMFSAILNLHHAQHVFQLSAEQAFAEITEKMQAAATSDTEKQDVQAWSKSQHEILDIVRTLVPGHPLLLAEKANRVIFAHQNVLSNVHVYTDVRPIFNETADSIVQMVVTHALSIDYQDGRRSQKIVLTMDAADVEDLRKACTRAERKAAVLKESMKPLQWPTFVYHEPDPSDVSGK